MKGKQKQVFLSEGGGGRGGVSDRAYPREVLVLYYGLGGWHLLEEISGMLKI